MSSSLSENLSNTKVNVVNLPTHTVITKSNYYSKCFFFFSGFHEQQTKYIKIFENLISETKSDIKIVLVEPKAYIPDKTVKFFLPDIMFNTRKIIYSYYRSVMKNEYEVSEIIFDAEMHTIALNLVIDEYNKLQSWEKISFGGFSMGARYALHLIEFLKADTKLLALKTYFMVYTPGEEDNLIYLSEYNTSENIKKVKVLISNYNQYRIDQSNEWCDGGLTKSCDCPSSKHTSPSTDPLFVSKTLNLKHSLSINDNLTIILDEVNINTISIISKYKLVFDTDEKHRIDNVLYLLKEHFDN